MDERLTVALPGRPVTARVVPPPGGAAGGAANSPGAAGDARAALEAERAELARTRRALERAAARVAELQDQVLRDTEGAIVDLAIDIARRILKCEIEAGRHDIAAIVGEAMKWAPSRREMVVHLNPQDLARLEQAQAGEALPVGPGARIVADPTVRPAECFVETAEGTVEARIEDQLEQVQRALKQPQ